MSFGGAFLLDLNYGWLLRRVPGLLSIVLAGGSPTLRSENPGLVKIVAGFVFPTGLVMIVLQGQELVTANMMVRHGSATCLRRDVDALVVRYSRCPRLRAGSHCGLSRSTGSWYSSEILLAVCSSGLYWSSVRQNPKTGCIHLTVHLDSHVVSSEPYLSYIRDFAV